MRQIPVSSIIIGGGGNVNFIFNNNNNMIWQEWFNNEAQNFSK